MFTMAKLSLNQASQREKLSLRSGFSALEGGVKCMEMVC